MKIKPLDPQEIVALEEIYKGMIDPDSMEIRRLLATLQDSREQGGDLQDGMINEICRHFQRILERGGRNGSFPNHNMERVARGIRELQEEVRALRDIAMPEGNP